MHTSLNPDNEPNDLIGKIYFIGEDGKCSIIATYDT